MTKLAAGRDSGYYDERLKELDAERDALQKRRAEVRRELANAKRREARQKAAEAERKERAEAWVLWCWLRDHAVTVNPGEHQERRPLLDVLRESIASRRYLTVDGHKMGRYGQPDYPEDAPDSDGYA